MIRLKIRRTALEDTGFALMLACCPFTGLLAYALAPELVAPALSISGLLVAVFAPKFC